MTNSEQLERETQSCRDELADTLDELRARMTLKLTAVFPGAVDDNSCSHAERLSYFRAIWESSE